MGTMLKYGSEGAKSFYDKYVIPPHIAKAHAEGQIHIHDKDFYTLTETCCQIDLIKLFHNGFSTGHGYLREPNAISSYAALACIAIQANQNEMHGGQSVPNFDYSMAQGVDKTYSKEYFKALIQFFQVSKAMPYDQVKAMVDNVKENLGGHVDMDKAQAYGQKVAGTCPATSGRTALRKSPRRRPCRLPSTPPRPLGGRRTRPPTRPWKPWCTT